MSGNIQILALPRDDDDRLVVRWLGDGQRHAVEIGIERKTLDGWELHRRVVVLLSEIFSVHDAIGTACSLATTVRR